MVSLFGRGFESHQLHIWRRCRKFLWRVCGIFCLIVLAWHCPVFVTFSGVAILQIHFGGWHPHRFGSITLLAVPHAVRSWLGRGCSPPLPIGRRRWYHHRGRGYPCPNHALYDWVDIVISLGIWVLQWRKQEIAALIFLSALVNCCQEFGKLCSRGLEAVFPML